MYIHGSFYNKQDEKVTVLIVTKGDRTTEREIGKEEDGLFFSDDPVEITSQVNDTLDVLLCCQASIRLLCRDYVPDFFCNSCREAVVNILVDDKCCFAGFIEPQAFSQGYNEELDEVELTCIDSLSALQYSNYRNIGTPGITYAGVKASAGQRTFYDILREMLEGVTEGLDITGQTSLRMYTDNSVKLRTGVTFYSMRHISISELLFLGDEEDDTWTQETVMTELLKYLNLHIVQDGTSFYIFNWQTVRGNNWASFSELITMESGYTRVNCQAKNITTDLVADCDTQISIAETYNQILLTDSVTEVDNVIESPLDSDSLIVAGNYQKYMTEYISDGEGVKAYKAMRAMVTGRNDRNMYDTSQYWRLAQWRDEVVSDNGEDVTVNLTSKMPDTNVEGLTLFVYVNNGDVPRQYATDGKGQAQFTVEKGATYKVVFPCLSGCNPINPEQHVAAVGNRIIDAEYTNAVTLYEHVTIIVKQEGEDGMAAACNGKKIRLATDQESKEYVADELGMVSFDVANGKSVPRCLSTARTPATATARHLYEPRGGAAATGERTQCKGYRQHALDLGIQGIYQMLSQSRLSQFRKTEIQK